MYIAIMKPVLALTACLVIASPSWAEDTGEIEEGITLLGEATRLIMRGIVEEMEPAMRELSGALMDLNAYHAPEVLPNGDIIIRRKVPLTVEPEAETDIEL